MEMLEACALAALMGAMLLFCWFLYDREVRNGIIMEDFRDDFRDTLRTVKACTPADAEEVIDRFFTRWEALVPHWTLVDHTHQLYQTIIDPQMN